VKQKKDNLYKDKTTQVKQSKDNLYKDKTTQVKQSKDILYKDKATQVKQSKDKEIVFLLFHLCCFIFINIVLLCFICVVLSL
jgi:ABC-type siderophore export system fused ATPase/permease subunit